MQVQHGYQRQNVDGAVQLYLIILRFIILTLSLENRFSYQLGGIAKPSPGLANYQRYALNCMSN